MKKIIYTIIILSVFASCEIDNMPKEVRIDNIYLQEYPQTYGGEVWDVFSLFAVDFPPDPYIQIHKGTQLIFTSGTFPNASGEIIKYPVNHSFNPNESYTLTVYDEDMDGDDTMGEISTFYPYSSAYGTTPDTKIVSGGGITVELELSYIY